MKRPPMLMRVQVRREERGFRLWLPLFLLLPVALAFLIALSPLILVASVIVGVTGRGRQLPVAARTSLAILSSVRGIGAVLNVLCSTPGLRVEVCDENNRERVHVSVI
jgi:hypothetical protein